MSEFASAGEAARVMEDFSARLRKAESAWNVRIWEMSRGPLARARAGERGPAIVAELEAALAQADREAGEMRRSAAGDEAAAAEWRRRAWLSMVQGRDDLAGQAAARLREHKEAARATGEDVVRLEALAAAVREVLATLHAAP